MIIVYPFLKEHKNHFVKGPPNNFFFLKMFKKNYWKFFSNSFFIWKYNPYG